MTSNRCPLLLLLTAIICSLILSPAIFPVDAFATTTRTPPSRISRSGHDDRECRHQTSLSVIGTGAASLISGSIGGAIGVGVAYPLDTLKTKSQVYSQQATQQRNLQNESIRTQTNDTMAVEFSASGGSVVCKADECYPVESPEDDLVSLVKLILETEGIGGFFGGVKAMMIGQALIKSVAFSANELALGTLNSNEAIQVLDGQTQTFVSLLLAASFSGFVTSFLVAPVERVKVMMQAQQNSVYANELECIQAVLENEGWGGLFSRGLGPTLAREVPSYAIYFVVYGLLIKTSTASSIGSLAPLVCGALSGCACWVPVYPIDVVKTLVQNTEGGDSASSIDVAIQLYQDEGISAFFNGLTPKMLRASVNHAVTFWIYALMMDALV